jgi:imidazole glycerol-phosphate synthase subunit HisH
MNAKVVIIDYGMGNVFSVKNALDALKVESIISCERRAIMDATHIILPGVGAFAEGMESLKNHKLIPLLEDEVLREKKPFLGICLGIQLLASAGEEHGVHAGLGWISGRVRRFVLDEKKYPVPHIGWNDVTLEKGNLLFTDISNPVFYFVHSYHIDVADNSTTAAKCDYGGEFVAAVQRGNIFGVQFHPEKSQKSGLQLLRNFLDHA